MAHIDNKDIRKELRFVGSVIRKIMPVFTKEQLVKLSTKCEKYLTGKWPGAYHSGNPVHRTPGRHNATDTDLHK